jgi:hypothetical protein
MSTNYRTNKVFTATSGSNIVAAPDKCWGVMRGTSATGTLYLTSGSISIADLPVGAPFPCYPNSVLVSAGSLYFLS